MKGKCETCLYAREEPGCVRCYRYPPSVVSHEGRLEQVFLKVVPNTVCGEYVNKYDRPDEDRPGVVHTCATCEYLHPEATGLFCLRYPPTVLVHKGGIISATLCVKSTGFCGEWRKRDNPGEQHGEVQ